MGKILQNKHDTANPTHVIPGLLRKMQIKQNSL